MGGPGQVSVNYTRIVLVVNRRHQGSYECATVYRVWGLESPLRLDLLSRTVPFQIRWCNLVCSMHPRFYIELHQICNGATMQIFALHRGQSRSGLRCNDVMMSIPRQLDGFPFPIHSQVLITCIFVKSRNMSTLTMSEGRSCKKEPMSAVSVEESFRANFV